MMVCPHCEASAANRLHSCGSALHVPSQSIAIVSLFITALGIIFHHCQQPFCPGCSRSALQAADASGARELPGPSALAPGGDLHMPCSPSVEGPAHHHTSISPRHDWRASTTTVSKVSRPCWTIAGTVDLSRNLSSPVFACRNHGSHTDQPPFFGGLQVHRKPLIGQRKRRRIKPVFRNSRDHSPRINVVNLCEGTNPNQG